MFGYTRFMLTDTTIKRLQPKPTAYRVFDSALSGFGVKVEQSGVRLYVGAERCRRPWNKRLGMQRVRF